MLDDETTNLESNLLGVRTDYHGPFLGAAGDFNQICRAAVMVWIEAANAVDAAVLGLPVNVRNTGDGRSHRLALIAVGTAHRMVLEINNPGGTTHMISARLCDPSDHDQFEAK
jgi:hypothetical protein